MKNDLPAKENESSVIVECDLDEPPEKVWRALTVPEHVADWLLPNDMRAEPGSRFTLKADEVDGGNITCDVLAIEPNRLISYSWRGEEALRDADDRPLDTVVTFILSENGTGGTHLRLVHRGFAAISDLSLCDTRSNPPVTSLATARDARRRAPHARMSAAWMTGGRTLRWAA
jgi:uncharacterized protein YndB with AHSA1/START domain